jgi:quercetin dioxygenase-like cupin family protein
MTTEQAPGMTTERGTGMTTERGTGMTTEQAPDADAAAAKPAVLVRDAGQGPATWALGSLFERLASPGETAGSLGVSLVTQPPGTATPIHVHTLEDEAFYLLDGTMTYSADGQLHRLGAGSFIFLPRGLPHGFRVTGNGPVRFLAVTMPGTLMSLYDEVGRAAGRHELPPPDQDLLMADVHRWLEAAPRYGLRVVGPPLPADA